MMARIDFTMDDVKVALHTYAEEKLGINLSINDLIIETKSKQNYRSEWEHADFRAHLIRT